MRATIFHPGGGGCTLGNSWWRCTVRWWLVLQILALFQTKKCYFPHRFSDLASCFHKQKLCHHYSQTPLKRTRRGHRECGVWSEREQKDFLKSISNLHITLSFPLIWDKGESALSCSGMKGQIRSRSSLKNHPLFQTKMGKVDYTCF